MSLVFLNYNLVLCSLLIKYLYICWKYQRDVIQTLIFYTAVLSVLWLVSYWPGNFPTAVIAWLLSRAEVQRVAFAAVFCEDEMPHRIYCCVVLLCSLLVQALQLPSQNSWDLQTRLSLIEMQIPVTACGVWGMKSCPRSQAHQKRVGHEDCRILAPVAMDRQDASTRRKYRYCFKQKCKNSLCSEEHFKVLHCTSQPFLFVSYVKLMKLCLVKYFITVHFVQ